MSHDFDHAANDSPRSGSSKQTTPILWGAVVVTIIALAIWYSIRI
jgi:hypothetical protein